VKINSVLRNKRYPVGHTRSVKQRCRQRHHRYFGTIKFELEKANLNDANGTKTELKSKKTISNGSNLHTCLFESIDARTSRCLLLYHKNVQALRAMNLQNIDGRMTQAISALRTELEADTAC
jgi:hypothetical protein